MTFATIMVTVDFDQASKARINLAADLAVRFKSVLIGVAGRPLLKPDHKSASETRNSRAPDLRNRYQMNLNIWARNFERLQKISLIGLSGVRQ
jgi:hypothetical protein